MLVFEIAFFLLFAIETAQLIARRRALLISQLFSLL
jgi:hypothetical protein